MRRTKAIEELKARSIETRKPERLETDDEYFLCVAGKLVAYQLKIHQMAPAP